ncbi:hypothetical protein [Methanosphaera sp. WGK6]|uniref:hypothetical protein n=1 Tax=Methanosphaera sp. WGK6 TaxID=1561964 RepID=UPI00084C6759|nr:hypothetical protein [Methanosphaera sp. WGK6]OED30378.1 hypothetical protein NL43_03120 [Methanosphaera sp. WGK6]
MEISAEEMKRSIQKIYDMLDEVSPVGFDCGTLCGEICCVYDDDCSDEKVALYLLPGEELMYEDSDSFNLYAIDSRDIDYPHSWTDDVFVVECVNPPRCEREIRPIQCRTFPLIPHISSDGVFHLILDKHEMPYECPIIEKNIKLEDSFVKRTYDVWKILIRDPVVYDLVAFDSRRRDNRRNGYKIVI